MNPHPSVGKDSELVIITSFIVSNFSYLLRSEPEILDPIDTPVKPYNESTHRAIVLEESRPSFSHPPQAGVYESVGGQRRRQQRVRASVTGSGIDGWRGRQWRA